jgi:hypothetical protein
MPSTIQLATTRRTRHCRRTGGASAKLHATYVTTASQSRGFGIRSQHSGKQERDRPCDPHNYLAHINLPAILRNRVMRLAQTRSRFVHPSPISLTVETMWPVLQLPGMLWEVL